MSITPGVQERSPAGCLAMSWEAEVEGEELGKGVVVCVPAHLVQSRAVYAAGSF